MIVRSLVAHLKKENKLAYPKSRNVPRVSVKASHVQWESCQVFDDFFQCDQVDQNLAIFNIEKITHKALKLPK